VLVFLSLMVMLAVMAAVSLSTPPRRITGLADDPDVRAAEAALAPLRPLASGDFPLRTALAGLSVPGWRESAGQAAAARAADSLLAVAQARRPLDPRIEVARAHLALGARHYGAAARRYERALALAPTYGEAHLGCAVALAHLAQAEADPRERRALDLRAAAHFIAVPEEDPARAEALFGQAVVLERAGRPGEAGRAARAYLAREPGGPWAERLRMHLSRTGGSG
jgi:predicted Zn-dependent protease